MEICEPVEKSDNNEVNIPQNSFQNTELLPPLLQEDKEN